MASEKPTNQTVVGIYGTATYWQVGGKAVQYASTPTMYTRMDVPPNTPTEQNYTHR
jgi:hypothetical protein